jgi:hypothetical protein
MDSSSNNGLGLPGPHDGQPRLLHDRPDVGKVEVDEPPNGNEIRYALDGEVEDLVGTFEGRYECHVLSGDLQQLLVGDAQQGIDVFGELHDPGLGLFHPPLVLEGKGLGHHCHRQRPDLLGDLRADGGSACTGAAPHPGRDEDHVGAGQVFSDLLPVLLRGLSADLRIGSRSESPGQLGAELQLQAGLGGRQGLGVGIGADEVNPGKPHLDHIIHGIATAAAHANHLDLGPPQTILHKLEHIHGWVLRD